MLTFPLLMAGFLAGGASAETAWGVVPEANPGRPTVSTPATLVPVGYLQLESGILTGDRSPEFSKRLAVEQAAKLAVHPRAQLVVQSEPWVKSRSESNAAAQPGEVFLGGHFALLLGTESRPTVSVAYFRRLRESPVPEPDLGTFRQSGMLMASHNVLGFHVDANVLFLEESNRGYYKGQNGQTLSVSHPLGAFTLAGEIWHFSQPFLQGDAVGTLWALSYSVRRNLVIDAGFDRGLTRTSTQWQFFAGFAYLLPYRLWR